MPNNQAGAHARIRSRRMRDFFYHLVVFLFVLVLLFLVTGLDGAVVWLFLFWGFAVALHAVYAFFG